MKKFFSLIFVLLIIASCILFYKYHQEIITYAVRLFTSNDKIKAPTNNDYHQDYDFELVKDVDNFSPQNKNDILNIIYTVLNSGTDEFSFYCENEYKNCIDDINDLSNDKFSLSIINNLVSPYNSYSKLYITTNDLGKVTITMDKLYTEEDIKNLNNKLDEIEKEIIKENMSNKDKIKSMHDYIINHSVYDSERANNIKSGNDANPKHQSHKANGPLLEGISLCSGYSDAMKIYLDRLNLPNYKISNNDHIWNFVYLDGKWLHLDLTWDDPVTATNQNLLLHKFFLISTNDLLKLDPSGHTFNEKYYPEAKSH